MIRKTMSLRISAADSFKCTSYCLAVQIINWYRNSQPVHEPMPSLSTPKGEMLRSDAELVVFSGAPWMSTPLVATPSSFTFHIPLDPICPAKRLSEAHNDTWRLCDERCQQHGTHHDSHVCITGCDVGPLHNMWRQGRHQHIQ